THFLGASGAHSQQHAFVSLHEIRNNLWHEVGGGVQHADAQSRSGGIAVEYTALSNLGGAHQGLAIGEQLNTLLSQADAATVAMKQSMTKLGLQATDLGRNIGLAGRQFHGSAR